MRWGQTQGKAWFSVKVWGVCLVCLAIFGGSLCPKTKFWERGGVIQFPRFKRRQRNSSFLVWECKGKVGEEDPPPPSKRKQANLCTDGAWVSYVFKVGSPMTGN